MDLFEALLWRYGLVEKRQLRRSHTLFEFPFVVGLLFEHVSFSAQCQVSRGKHLEVVRDFSHSHVVVHFDVSFS